MSKPYRVVKDPGPGMDFRPQARTVIYEYHGYDYGLCRDDEEATEVEHNTFTLNKDGSGPFFTMPMSDVEEISE